jgi:hypothetical protein
MNEQTRRTKATHELAIRLARNTANFASKKITRDTAKARLAELEASFAAKYATV